MAEAPLPLLCKACRTPYGAVVRDGSLWVGTVQLVGAVMLYSRATMRLLSRNVIGVMQ